MSLANLVPDYIVLQRGATVSFICAAASTLTVEAFK
jgi:hypothetical protein